MKYTYEEIQNSIGDVYILRSDGASIPKDPGNSDYQRYLRWLNGEEETQGGMI